MLGNACGGCPKGGQAGLSFSKTAPLISAAPGGDQRSAAAPSRVSCRFRRDAEGVSALGAVLPEAAPCPRHPVLSGRACSSFAGGAVNTAAGAGGGGGVGGGGGQAHGGRRGGGDSSEGGRGRSRECLVHLCSTCGLLPKMMARITSNCGLNQVDAARKATMAAAGEAAPQGKAGFLHLKQRLSSMSTAAPQGTAGFLVL